MLLRNPDPPSPDWQVDDYNDDGDFDDGASEHTDTSEEPTPKYTRGELVSIIADFYKCLVRMYIPDAALKFPPPTGWDNINSVTTANWPKSEFVIDLARHLPYIHFDDDREAHRVALDFKCYCQDYSLYTAKDFSEPEFGEELAFADKWLEECELPSREHWLTLTWGFETFGKYLLLDTINGEVSEEVIRDDRVDGVDVRTYFADLKREYEELLHVPIPGCEHAGGCSPIGLSMTMVEPPVSQEKNFPTDVDTQWVRKIYHDHGWPGETYDKAAPLQKIEDYKQRREAMDRTRDV